MSAVATAIQESLPPGPRYALHACALTIGASRGPTLLQSAAPEWEYALRSRIGDQLFTPDDPGRPRAQAWVGAVWLEPQWTSWRAELQEIAAALPGGGLLSIVTSLPLALLRSEGHPSALGLRPSGWWRLRSGLLKAGFRVERVFAFHTPWWSMLRWLAARLGPRRPDWSDRIQSVMRYRFATRSFVVPLATTGLIQARTRMRPWV